MITAGMSESAGNAAVWSWANNAGANSAITSTGVEEIIWSR